MNIAGDGGSGDTFDQGGDGDKCDPDKEDCDNDGNNNNDDNNNKNNGGNKVSYSEKSTLPDGRAITTFPNGTIMLTEVNGATTKLNYW